MITIAWHKVDSIIELMNKYQKIIHNYRKVIKIPFNFLCAISKFTLIGRGSNVNPISLSTAIIIQLARESFIVWQIVYK